MYGMCGLVLIDPLDQPLIDTLIDQYLINTLLTPKLTLDQHFVHQSVASQLIFDSCDSCIRLGQHSADCGPTCHHSRAIRDVI